MSNFVELFPLGAEFLHAERRTDRHEEVNNRFSRCCKKRSQTSFFFFSKFIILPLLMKPHIWEVQDSYLLEDTVHHCRYFLHFTTTQRFKNPRQIPTRNLNFFIHRLYYLISVLCLSILFCIINIYGPGSSVGVGTDHGLDGPGSNPGGDEIFRPSRPALRPTSLL